MKKLLSILLALALLVAPLSSVFAATETVNKGDAITFKQNHNTSDYGVQGKELFTHIALENSTTDTQNVKVWSGVSFALNAPTTPLVLQGDKYGLDSFFNEMISAVNQANVEYFAEGTSVEKFRLPELNDFLNVFSTSMNDAGEYEIDMNANKNTFKELSLGTKNSVIANKDYGSAIIKGFVTSTPYENDTTKLWALVFEEDAAGNITSAKIAPVSASETIYHLSFVATCDKSFTCGESKACYLCDGKYVYDVDTNIDTAICTKVADKDINTCVKNAPTGTKEYIVEALAIVGICIIGLTIIKRKDSFRSI